MTLLEKIESSIGRFDQFVDNIESVVVGLVAKIAPWASPLPTAFLVYNRTMTHLGWPVWIAAVAAIVIETLGLSTSATVLILYRYNKTKRKSDPKAPLVIPIVLTAIYIITAETLTVALDIASKQWQSLTLTDWAPAMFPALSLTGMVLLAVRADHTQRVREIEEGKVEARQRRLETKQRKEQTRKSIPDWAKPHQCQICGWWPGKKEGLTEPPENLKNMIGGHAKSHYIQVRKPNTASAAREWLKEKYPDGTIPTIREIATMRKENND